MNTVTVDGIVTRDPELRQAGEYTVAKLSIAHKDERGMTTSFFDIEAWNELGAQASHLKRGNRIAVEGSIKQDSWVAPDGTKRNKIKIIAKKISEEKKSFPNAHSEINDSITMPF